MKHWIYSLLIFIFSANIAISQEKTQTKSCRFRKSCWFRKLQFGWADDRPKTSHFESFLDHGPKIEGFFLSAWTCQKYAWRFLFLFAMTPADPQTLKVAFKIEIISWRWKSGVCRLRPGFHLVNQIFFINAAGFTNNLRGFIFEFFGLQGS